MNSSLQEVTVIVPTLGLAERRETLMRALESVLGQTGVDARPLLVVNGSRFDEDLIRELRSNPRITVTMREAPNLPGAIQAGRRMVRTPYVMVLDDDDQLLPGALSLRVEALLQHPEVDVVVTNALRRSTSEDTLHVIDHRAVQRDPLGTLLEINWLIQGSWLCRTDALSAALLAEMPQHLECTYLAACFAMTGRMLFLETPTVVWSLDTPGSASKSEEYRRGEVTGLRAIRRLPVPDWFRRGIDRKIAASFHALSDTARQSGRSADAWRWHLNSLVHRGGLRYLGFTRHLLAEVFRR